MLTAIPRSDTVTIAAASPTHCRSAGVARREGRYRSGQAYAGLAWRDAYSSKRPDMHAVQPLFVFFGGLGVDTPIHRSVLCTAKFMSLQPVQLAEHAGRTLEDFFSTHLGN